MPQGLFSLRLQLPGPKAALQDSLAALAVGSAQVERQPAMANGSASNCWEIGCISGLEMPRTTTVKVCLPVASDRVPVLILEIHFLSSSQATRSQPQGSALTYLKKAQFQNSLQYLQMHRPAHVFCVQHLWPDVTLPCLAAWLSFGVVCCHLGGILRLLAGCQCLWKYAQLEDVGSPWLCRSCLCALLCLCWVLCWIGSSGLMWRTGLLISTLRLLCSSLSWVLCGLLCEPVSDPKNKGMERCGLALPHSLSLTTLLVYEAPVLLY